MPGGTVFLFAIRCMLEAKPKLKVHDVVAWLSERFTKRFFSASFAAAIPCVLGSLFPLVPAGTFFYGLQER